MQIFRTIVWVLLLAAFIAFSFGNFDKPIAVSIWPGYVWETRVPALVVVSFLLGALPIWLIHRGQKWRLQRRISALESAARATAKPRAQTSQAAASPAPASTTAAAAPAQPANPVNPEPTKQP